MIFESISANFRYKTVKDSWTPLIPCIWVDSCILRSVKKQWSAGAHSPPFQTHTYTERGGHKHQPSHIYVCAHTWPYWWKALTYRARSDVLVLHGKALCTPQTVWCYNSGTSCVSDSDHHRKLFWHLAFAVCTCVCVCVGCLKSHTFIFFIHFGVAQKTLCPSPQSYWPRVWILALAKTALLSPRTQVTPMSSVQLCVCVCDRVLNGIYMFCVFHTIKYTKN